MKQQNVLRILNTLFNMFDSQNIHRSVTSFSMLLVQAGRYTYSNPLEVYLLLFIPSHCGVCPGLGILSFF